MISIETLKAIATLLILAATIYSFVREKIPPDLTALLALCALLVTGILTPQEAFSGFSHPATISVAAVLVLSAAVEGTGLLNHLARRVLSPLGKSEFVFTLSMMILIGALSAFINNTAAVAIFIPVVLEVCRRTGASPGRVLMPMSHAATMGGMCTLVGTSTNLVAHEFARSAGLPGFSMFELGKAGLPVALAGFTYMLLVGRWFLPQNRTEGNLALGQDDKYLAEIAVLPDSPWVGREVLAKAVHRDFDLDLRGLERHGKWLDHESGTAQYAEGDVLHVRGGLKHVMALANQQGMGFRRPGRGLISLTAVEKKLPLAEVVVLTPSGLIGRTLKDSRFSERYDVIVLALKRRDNPEGVLATTPLHAGDVLVVEGPDDALRELADTTGFLVIGTPAHTEQRSGRLAITLLTLVAVVTVVSFGLVPIVTAATAGCAVLMLTGCLRPREAYQAIDLSLVFLLAGSLALGLALEKTGITRFVAEQLAALSGSAGSFIVLAGFFLLSVVVSELMSNSGTVALLGPMALSASEQLQINPMTLLVAVAFGSSAAFAMPIGYQTSLMIYGPGGYRFADFIRMGIALDVIVAVLALWLIPQIWPFHP